MNFSEIADRLGLLFNDAFSKTPYVETASKPFFHYSIQIPLDDSINLLELCRQNKGYVSYYWFDHDTSTERLGFGIADQVDFQHSNDCSTEVLSVQNRLAFCQKGTQYFGGMSFNISDSHINNDFSDFGPFL